MFDKKVYTIGEIADLFHMSTKTLRFYEDKGLLEPEGRHEENGYRYYTKKQILQIILIKELKHLGFALNEISDFNEDKTLEQLIGTLKKKEENIKREMKALTRQKTSIEKALNRIIKVYLLMDDYYEEDQENHYQFELIEVPSSYVVYTVSDYDYNLEELFLDRYADLVKVRDHYGLFSKGPFMAVFDGEYTDAASYSANEVTYMKGALEVFMPIIKGKKIDLPCVKKYGNFLAAKTIYKGNYRKILRVYDSFLKWGLENDYCLSGPPVEEYIVDPITSDDEKSYVTAVYFPVEKIPL